MKFSALLVASIAAALSGVSAAPTETTTAKRACTTNWSATRGNFQLERTGTKFTTQDIDFSIPADAVGPCSLVVSFPKGEGIHYSGNTRANVYERLPDQNWAIGSLVGTVELKGSETEDTFRVINSFACKPTMAYSFRLDETGDGKVVFSQREGAGIGMTYGC